MKNCYRLIALTAIFIITTAFLCSAKEDFSRKYRIIRMPQGKTFTLDLESNPSTGFSWQLIKISDKMVVKLIDKKYIPSAENIIGSKETERWRFKTLKKGKAIIIFEYRRDWEKDSPAQGRQEYTIFVK